MARKSFWMIWFTLFIVFTVANYYFRLILAVEDPQFGLALEVLEDQDGFQSQSRVKLYLAFGADPNLAFKHWEPPLVEAAIRNKEHTVRLLLPSADVNAVRLAAEAVCSRSDVEKPMLLILAQHLQVEPDKLCLTQTY